MTMVYRRDASWQRRAGTSAYAYHSPNPDDEALAACSSRIALHEETGQDHTQVGWQLCRRPACRKRIWPR